MSDLTRKKDTGEPGNGGQFGHTARASSGISLSPQPDTPPAGGTHGSRTDEALAEARLAAALDSMSAQDRKLLAALLDPENDSAGWLDGDTPAERFEALEQFAGYEGVDFDSEVRIVGEFLSEQAHRAKPDAAWGDIPRLQIVYDSEAVPVGFEASVDVGGFSLVEYHDLKDAGGKSATGARAAVAIAASVSGAYARVEQKRAELEPRPMTVEELSGVSKVMELKAREARVRLVLPEFGDNVLEGVVLSRVRLCGRARCLRA